MADATNVHRSLDKFAKHSIHGNTELFKNVKRSSNMDLKVKRYVDIVNANVLLKRTKN